jgi:hypothetical protein
VRTSSLTGYQEVGAANLGCREIALIDKLSISIKHNLAIWPLSNEQEVLKEMNAFISALPN